MPVPKQRQLTAPGKLLLFGEHAAVYGYPALGVTIPRNLSLLAEPAGPSSPLELVFPTLPVPPETAEEFVKYLEAVATSEGIQLSPARLTVTSEIPVGGGFGSSAALCTVLARRLAGDAADLHTVWMLAHRLEHFFHGTPSGIDTGLTTLTGAHAFRFSGIGPPGRGTETLPTAVSVQLPESILVTGSIPRTRSTRELVAAVAGRRASDPEGTGKILRKLGSICEEVIQNDGLSVGEFAAAASAAQRLLAELGVSTATLETVIRAGIDAGALGGKLSGAGGGGAFYFVCPDEKVAQRVATAVSRHIPDSGTVLTVSTRS